MKLLFLFILGAALIASTIERTLLASRGFWLQTGVASAVTSTCIWFNMQSVANNRPDEFIAFSAGTVVASMAVAYRYKLRNDERDQLHRPQSPLGSS